MKEYPPSPNTLRLKRLPYTLGIGRLHPEDQIPEWLFQSPFFQLVRTEDEVSVVCLQELFPEGMDFEGDWRILAVEGPLDFSLTGILNRITAPLAEASIPLYAISTYLTDYILVKEAYWQQTLDVLRKAGWIFGV